MIAGTGKFITQKGLSKLNDSIVNKKKRILIVGGGTAGIVIFNELKKHFEVTVFDQNEVGKIPFYFRIPIAIGLLFSRNNKYVTKFNICSAEKRLIPFFKSNCLGGASVINGSVHVMGSLVAWRGVFEKFAFDFDNFFKLYRSSFTKKNDKQKVKIRQQSSDELDKAFFKSLRSFSVEKSGSEFFATPSCGPILNTVKGFFRSSVLEFLPKGVSPIRLSSTVDNIDVKGGLVKGVWVDNKFIAADTVIISAGVAGTGKLLCRLTNNSPKDLARKKIFGVKDHTNIRINVRAKKDILSLNQVGLPFFRRVAYIFKNRRQLLSLIRGSGASSAANIDLYGTGEISLRVNLLRFHESGRLGSSGKLFDNCDHGFSLSLTQVNPKSYGAIDEDGNIDPAYLADNEDLQFLKDALLYAIKLLETPPLSEYVGEIIDLQQILEAPEEYVMKNFYSGYHLIGGASGLIDADFKFKGIEGLYVCDASVLSEYPSSNIHSSVVLLAKVFSKKFVDKFNLGDLNARF